jgi:hypothetical protein
MKFARCFLKGPDNPLRWIDYPLPEAPQAFINFITTVRINGAVYPQPGMQVFIPFDEIKLAFEIEAGAPMLAGIIHEAPGTKQ